MQYFFVFLVMLVAVSTVVQAASSLRNIRCRHSRDCIDSCAKSCATNTAICLENFCYCGV